MHATLIKSENIAADIHTYWFRPDHRIRYQPGQYAEITVPHESTDDRGASRLFTLSSSPSEELISITLKHSSHGESTFKQSLRNMPPGSKIFIGNPMGDFILPINRDTPLVFVASGIGITPVRSIIKWLSDNDEHRDIHIIYVVRSEEKLIYEDLFRSYKCNLHIFLTEPSTDGRHRIGRPAAEDVLNLTGRQDGALYFLSGIQSMVEEMQYELMERHGVDRSRITLDYFPGYRDL